MVVLDELGAHAGCFFERLGIEAFVEKTALVAKHLGLDDQHAGQFSGQDLHWVSPARL